MEPNHYTLAARLSASLAIIFLVVGGTQVFLLRMALPSYRTGVMEVETAV
jgi:hypothetical protein